MVLAVLGTFWVALQATGLRDGRDNLYRGALTELAYMVVGYRYDVSLSCTIAPYKRANTLRGDDSGEAIAYLKQVLPGCDVTWMSSSYRRG